jgi:hypothetical protein
MEISKGEYCQFSLEGRVRFVREFGHLLGEVWLEKRRIRIYRLYDFYVETWACLPDLQIEKAEPISPGLLPLYRL